MVRGIPKLFTKSSDRSSAMLNYNNSTIGGSNSTLETIGYTSSYFQNKYDKDGNAKQQHSSLLHPRATYSDDDGNDTIGNNTIQSDDTYTKNVKSILQRRKKGRKDRNSIRSVSWSDTFDTYEEAQPSISRDDETIDTYTKREEENLIRDFNFIYPGDTDMSYQDSTFDTYDNGRSDSYTDDGTYDTRGRSESPYTVDTRVSRSESPYTVDDNEPSSSTSASQKSNTISDTTLLSKSSSSFEEGMEMQIIDVSQQQQMVPPPPPPSMASPRPVERKQLIPQVHSSTQSIATYQAMQPPPPPPQPIAAPQIEQRKQIIDQAEFRNIAACASEATMEDLNERYNGGWDAVEDDISDTDDTMDTDDSNFMNDFKQVIETKSPVDTTTDVEGKTVVEQQLLPAVPEQTQSMLQDITPRAINTTQEVVAKKKQDKKKKTKKKKDKVISDDSSVSSIWSDFTSNFMKDMKSVINKSGIVSSQQAVTPPPPPPQMAPKVVERKQLVTPVLQDVTPTVNVVDEENKFDITDSTESETSSPTTSKSKSSIGKKLKVNLFKKKKMKKTDEIESASSQQVAPPPPPLITERKQLIVLNENQQIQVDEPQPTVVVTTAKNEEASVNPSSVLVPQKLELPPQVMHALSQQSFDTLGSGALSEGTIDSLLENVAYKNNMSFGDDQNYLHQRAASDDTMESLTKKRQSRSQNEIKEDIYQNEQKKADDTFGHIGLILPFWSKLTNPFAVVGSDEGVVSSDVVASSKHNGSEVLTKTGSASVGAASDEQSKMSEAKIPGTTTDENIDAAPLRSKPSQDDSTSVMTEHTSSKSITKSVSFSGDVKKSASYNDKSGGNDVAPALSLQKSASFYDEVVDYNNETGSEEKVDKVKPNECKEDSSSEPSDASSTEDTSEESKGSSLSDNANTNTKKKKRSKKKRSKKKSKKQKKDKVVVVMDQSIIDILDEEQSEQPSKGSSFKPNALPQGKVWDYDDAASCGDSCVTTESILGDLKIVEDTAMMIYQKMVVGGDTAQGPNSISALFSPSETELVFEAKNLGMDCIGQDIEEGNGVTATVNKKKKPKSKGPGKVGRFFVRLFSKPKTWRLGRVSATYTPPNDVNG